MNIKIKVTKELLSLSIFKEKTIQNLNNTNVIDTKELIFSLKYIEKNTDLVSSFINVIVIKNKISKMQINDAEIIDISLTLLNKMPSITKVYIIPDIALTYDNILKLLDNKTLEFLSCYSIPKFLLSRLDINKQLKMEVRSELFFISNFMSSNKLYKYSDIYYKKSIEITNEFTKDDIEDFKTFISINQYLKTIYIKKYSNNLVNYIIDLIIENRKNNIKIIFYEKNNDIDVIINSITYLKKVHEEYFKEFNITFDIIYSKEYKKENLFKQLNLNAVKITSFIAIIVLLFFIIAEHIQNSKDSNTILDINKEITSILEDIDYTDIDDQERDVEYIEADGEITTTRRASGGSVSSYYTNYEQVFEKLLLINPDTVGWLTVNNTKINYPVVKAKDNDYYLKRDYNQNKNSMGWIYMDYRNSINVLSQNTIIYGHNINGGLMFGSLRYTLNESWYKKSSNQIITFNTLNKNMKWQIFSIYKVGVTNDYLYANFNTDEEFLNFVDSLKARSIYDFGVSVEKDDHILTLSTCYGTGKQRLVVHAKLIPTNNEA